MLPVWKAVFGGETIGTFDQIRQMAPWNGPKPTRPWDVLQADSVLQFYGWRDLVFEGWSRGQLPLWNPFQLGGASLIGNSQSAPMYPLHILLGLLQVPTALAIGILAWIHLVAAAWGCFALVTRLGGSRAGGMLAGLSFSLSSFALGWLSLPSVLTTLCWVPWCLVAFEALWEHAGNGKWRPACLSAFGLSAALAMMLLGGHLQFAAYGSLTLLVFALCRLLGPGITAARRLAATGLALVALILAGAIAWPQLGSVLEYSQTSHRRVGPTEEGYAAYNASALPLGDLMQRLFDPMGQGNPTVALGPETPVSTFWPALARTGANFAESAVTLGPIVVVFFLFAVFSAPWRALTPALLVILLAGLMAFGSPLNHLLYFQVPGWSGTGSPGRAIALMVLMSSIVAGLGLGGKIDDRWRSTFPTAAVLACLLFVASAFWPNRSGLPSGFDASQWELLKSHSASNLAMMVVLLFAAIAFLALTKEQTRMAKGMAIGSVVAASFVTGVLDLVPLGKPLATQLNQERDPNARVAAINEPWALVVAAPAVLPPNTGTILRTHDIAGYDSLLQKDSLEALRAVNGQDPAPPANGNIMFVKPTADATKLADLGVRWVLARMPLEGWGAPHDSWNGLLRYRLDGPGRVHRQRGTARIVEERLDGLVIETTGAGPILLRDRLIPGWTAASDKGAVVLKRHPLGIEFEPPRDATKIELKYRPRAVATGILIAPLALLAGFGFLVFAPWLRDRKSTVSRPKDGER